MLCVPFSEHGLTLVLVGSGKSTLALALLATSKYEETERLIDNANPDQVIPEKGRILIDNVDIATVDKQALRRRIVGLPMPQQRLNQSNS